MKKGSKIKAEPEEIQFVGNNNEVLESNVDVPKSELSNEIVAQKGTLPEAQTAESAEPVNQISSQTVEQSDTTFSIPVTNDIDLSNVDLTIQPLEEINLLQATEQSNTISSAPMKSNIESSTTDARETEELNPSQTGESSNIESSASVVSDVGVSTVETSEVEKMQNVTSEIQTMQPSVMPEAVPITEVATLVMETMEQNIGEPLVQPALISEEVPEEPVKFKQINGKPEKQQKGKYSIFILMIITLLLMASIVVVYVFVLEPKMHEQTPENPTVPTVPVPTTSELVCTIERENAYDNTFENNVITFTYDNTNKSILTSSEQSTVTMNDLTDYMERKAMIKVFSQELNNTDGQKYTFKYDDNNLIYHVFIDRNYEKATNEEKDDTWKLTYDEANDYYLNQGYTCNGITKEMLNERTLTSTTGSNTVNYNNWIITYQKAVLSEDKTTLSITLSVQNNGTDVRTLNGQLKLFDANNENVRNVILNQEINPNDEVTLVIDVPDNNESASEELGSLETINLENVVAYLIELYR